MTVTNTSNRIKYSGNGSTTAFSFPNLVFDEDDLVVTLIDSSDVETVQTITTHYTVSGTGVPAGCTVTMVTAPASGEELLIERSMGYLQSSDYTDGGDLPAETLESDLDKAAIRDQQLKDIFDRTLKTPASETESNIGTLPAKTSRASKVFTFDSNGDPLASAFGDINVSIDIVESSPVDGHFLVHDGTNWINEAPATARASMGLGTAAVADTGVANGDVPAMDATGYPAANGSQITNLTLGNIALSAASIVGRLSSGAASELSALNVRNFLAGLFAAGGTHDTSSGTSSNITNLGSITTPQIAIGLADGVSLDGADNLLIQLGDSGGIETSGYTGDGAAIASGGSTIPNSTAGFVVAIGAAARSFTGAIVLIHAGSEKWFQFHVGRTTSGVVNTGGGVKTLSGALTQITAKPTGSNNFDGGSIAWFFA